MDLVSLVTCENRNCDCAQSTRNLSVSLNVTRCNSGKALLGQPTPVYIEVVIG